MKHNAFLLIVLGICITTIIIGNWKFTQSDYWSNDEDHRLKKNEERIHVVTDLLSQLSIQTPPITSSINGEIVIPSVHMAVLDAMKNCALPTEKENFCDEYRNGYVDPHVVQVIMTVLRSRCDPLGNIAEAPLVWDLGANVGQFSLFMRAMGCRVVAVEPQPAMNWFHKASRHVNGWEDDRSIALHEQAVSDTAGNITLLKLWQPGKKNAGNMTVDTVTIQQLADFNSREAVELVKLDIDGPEIYSLRGLANLTSYQEVKNIIVELTVKVWKKMGFEDDSVLEIFDRLYKGGYRMFLVFEEEFPKYPNATMGKLQRVENLGELRLSFEIPPDHIGEVLTMADRVTKNIFMTKDPAVLSLV